MPIPQKNEDRLKKLLSPHLQKLSAPEQLNFLLHLVQKSFEYKTDQDQFNKEKYFFAHETFVYPYSDCEDRSVLFANLVKALLGYNVVLLDYPEHIATAVEVPFSIEGKTVTHKGKTYLICDPTYINANIGMEMPNLKVSERKVVVF